RSCWRRSWKPRSGGAATSEARAPTVAAMGTGRAISSPRSGRCLCPHAAPGRALYGRGAGSNGPRHGHRPRQLVTTFGPLTLSVPRARLAEEAGEREWNSSLLPAYKRLSHRAEALIAEAYLAGVNTRRGRRALARLVEGHRGDDVVTRAWQKT